MANSVDYHAKLIIGDLVLRLAALAAENEALRETQRKPTRPVKVGDKK